MRHQDQVRGAHVGSYQRHVEDGGVCIGPNQMPQETVRRPHPHQTAQLPLWQSQPAGFLASSSCLISRSISSELTTNACLCGFAICNGKACTSWSWARGVADILAFSVCKVVIIAFKRTKPLGRFEVFIDMARSTKIYSKARYNKQY